MFRVSDSVHSWSDEEINESTGVSPGVDFSGVMTSVHVTDGRFSVTNNSVNVVQAPWELSIKNSM